MNFKIKVEWSSGQFKIQPGDEDVHTANERRLKVKVVAIIFVKFLFFNFCLSVCLSVFASVVFSICLLLPSIILFVHV